MSTVNCANEGILGVLLGLAEIICKNLEEIRDCNQAVFDDLRQQVYEELVKNLDGQRLPKDEFEDRLRCLWNDNGGAKVFAVLKKSEDTLKAAQKLVEEIHDRLSGK